MPSIFCLPLHVFAQFQCNEMVTLYFNNFLHPFLSIPHVVEANEQADNLSVTTAATIVHNPTIQTQGLS